MHERNARKAIRPSPDHGIPPTGLQRPCPPRGDGRPDHGPDGARSRHLSCSDATSFRLLGRLTATRTRREIDLGPLRQQAVLLVLLSQLDRPVPADDIVDAVWGTDAPMSGRKIVPPYVYRIRAVLCGRGGGRECTVLVRDRSGYRLVLEPGNLDTTTVRDLVARARTTRAGGRPEQAAAMLHAALSDWAEHCLPELPGPFADSERHRLREERLALLQERIELDMTLGRAASLIPELTGLLHGNPRWERLACLLMRTLVAAGRQSDALRVFADVRSGLVRELGVEPGPELRLAHQSVLAQV